MMALLVSYLALVALPMISDAKRLSTLNEFQVQDDMQAIENTSRDAVVGHPLLFPLGNPKLGKPVSKFSFSIKGTLCAELDFGELHGIVVKYPQAVAAMQARGRKLANEKNCRLCDIEGKEGSEAKVKCSACLEGNGNVGWRSDKNICTPCPSQCEKCEKPGVSNNPLKHHESEWFKCKHPGAYAEHPVSYPWECEPPQDRKSGYGQYQWCKYRSDFLGTAQNAYLPDSKSKWEIKITAARCDKTMDVGSKRIMAMMSGIKKKMSDYHSNNCELCHVMAEGSVFDRSKARVDAECAYDELGAIACRRDRGRVGWSKRSKRCLPCPYECTSCIDNDIFYHESHWFKCNLQTTEGASGQLAEVMLGKANEGPPKLPEGFDCESPIKKNCEAVESDSCMGYKTLCKYNVNSW